MTVYIKLVTITSECLIVKSTMLPHCNIHKYVWTCPDGKTQSHDCWRIDKQRWHSSI